MKHTHRHRLLAACSLAAALAGMAPELQAAAKPEEAKPQADSSGWGYGMGPGMMGGYGMGPGMMGGYGMGPGMMDGYWRSHLNLSDEQQTKINAIQDETRKKHWALMGAMMDQQARLRDLYAAPKRDDAAVDAAYQNFGKLQQQMYETSVDAQKRMEAVLTKEQQETLHKLWRRGWGAGY